VGNVFAHHYHWQQGSSVSNVSAWLLNFEKLYSILY
jgi:hypothetical protein